MAIIRYLIICMLFLPIAGFAEYGGSWEFQTNVTREEFFDQTSRTQAQASLLFDNSVSDLQGNVGDLVVDRASSSTGVDPETGLLTQYMGGYDQLTDVDAINDLSHASWTHSGVTAATDNVTETDAIGSHTCFVTGLSVTNGRIYCLRIQAKPGLRSYLGMFFYGGVAEYHAFHLPTETISTGGSSSDGFSAKIEAADDGWYDISVFFIAPGTTAGGMAGFDLRTSFEERNYAGDDSGIALYVRSFNVTELPSSFTLGPDISVSGITKANPGVVSATAHDLETGDYVLFDSLTEMTELNETIQTITEIDANSFSINDTSGYVAAETTGGNCANKISSAMVSEGGEITAPPYTATDTTQAEPVFESDGLRVIGTTTVNVLPYSEDFSEWTAENGGSVESGHVGPSGELDAYKLIDDATDTSARILYRNLSKIDGGQAISIFLKAGTSTGGRMWAYQSGNILPRIDFTWADGVPSITAGLYDYAGIEPVSNGWYRLWAVRLNEVFTTAEYSLMLYMTPQSANPGSEAYCYAFGANITANNHLCPYVPSHGAETIMASESAYFPLDDTTYAAIYNGEFSLAGNMVLGTNYGDLPASNIPLFTLNGATTNLLYLRQENLNSNDSTSVISRALNFVSGTDYRFALTAVPGNRFKLSGKATTGWGAWDTDSYDGDFPTDGTKKLWMCPTIYVPIWLKNIKIYDESKLVQWGH